MRYSFIDRDELETNSPFMIVFTYKVGITIITEEEWRRTYQYMNRVKTVSNL